MTDDLTALDAEFAAFARSGIHGTCKVCVHPQRPFLDHFMRRGAGSASIERFMAAKDWEHIGRGTLDRHKRLGHYLETVPSEAAS